MSRRRLDRLDEDDVRIRPSRSNSRPRSKNRPDHAEALPATVMTVDRGRFRLLDGDGDEHFAVKARELGRKGIVVGDLVEVVGMTSSTESAAADREDLARIVRRTPRATVLRRTADDDDPDERVIVANVDQLAIVVATAEPEPSFGLIDRALVAAYDAGIRPLILMTKSDLAPPRIVRDMYCPLGFPVVDARKSANSVRKHLKDHQTVLLGLSGVGKSTLVNRLIPSAERTTGGVNSVTGKGRHTSTSVLALPLSFGGWIVDTPGIRSFGLAHVDSARVLEAFPDLAQATKDCPRGCSHIDDHCPAGDRIARDKRAQQRLESLRRVLRSQDEAVL